MQYPFQSQDFEESNNYFFDIINQLTFDHFEPRTDHPSSMMRTQDQQEQDFTFQNNTFNNQLNQGSKKIQKRNAKPSTSQQFQLPQQYYYQESFEDQQPQISQLNMIAPQDHMAQFESNQFKFQQNNNNTTSVFGYNNTNNNTNKTQFMYPTQEIAQIQPQTSITQTSNVSSKKSQPKQTSIGEESTEKTDQSQEPAENLGSPQDRTRPERNLPGLIRNAVYNDYQLYLRSPQPHHAYIKKFMDTLSIEEVLEFSNFFEDYDKDKYHTHRTQTKVFESLKAARGGKLFYKLMEAFLSESGLEAYENWINQKRGQNGSKRYLKENKIAKPKLILKLQVNALKLL